MMIWYYLVVKLQQQNMGINIGINIDINTHHNFNNAAYVWNIIYAKSWSHIHYCLHVYTCIIYIQTHDLSSITTNIDVKDQAKVIQSHVRSNVPLWIDSYNLGTATNISGLHLTRSDLKLPKFEYTSCTPLARQKYLIKNWQKINQNWPKMVFEKCPKRYIRTLRCVRKRASMVELIPLRLQFEGLHDFLSCLKINLKTI